MDCYVSQGDSNKDGNSNQDDEYKNDDGQKYGNLICLNQCSLENQDGRLFSMSMNWGYILLLWSST